MLKQYCISFEGIDKSGKEQIRKYVDILGKHKYVLMDRGIMSNMVYSNLNKRNYAYDLEPFKHWTFVYLVCDEDDWNIRCKLTNEPAIDYKTHRKLFDDMKDVFIEDYEFDVISYNTSKLTPYKIAKHIIQHMEKINSVL